MPRISLVVAAALYAFTAEAVQLGATSNATLATELERGPRGGKKCMNESPNPRPEPVCKFMICNWDWNVGPNNEEFERSMNECIRDCVRGCREEDWY